MHFSRFFVSILHSCASVFLFSSISLLKLTFPMQIRGRQPRRRKKTGVPFSGRRSGSGSVYARLAQKPSNIVAIWSRVALPCGARKT